MQVCVRADDTPGGGFDYRRATLITRLYAARTPNGRPRLRTRYVSFQPECVGDFDYWRGFAEFWEQPVTLVNVEHDMQFTDGLVADLISCSHPLCTHAYRMHTPREYWAHSRDGICGMDGHWISEGEQWAAWSAIGFCKIDRSLRSRPLERSSWRGLEAAVNWSIRVEDLAHKWHVHWGPDGKGIEHYHYPD